MSTWGTKKWAQKGRLAQQMEKRRKMARAKKKMTDSDGAGVAESEAEHVARVSNKAETQSGNNNVSDVDFESPLPVSNAIDNVQIVETMCSGGILVTANIQAAVFQTKRKSLFFHVLTNMPKLTI